MVTFNLPHTNLAEHYVILAFNRRKYPKINFTCRIMTCLANVLRYQMLLKSQISIL